MVWVWETPLFWYCLQQTAFNKLSSPGKNILEEENNTWQNSLEGLSWSPSRTTFKQLETSEDNRKLKEW